MPSHYTSRQSKSHVRFIQGFAFHRPIDPPKKVDVQLLLELKKGLTVASLLIKHI